MRFWRKPRVSMEPLPPLSQTDYETTMKFLQAVEKRCVEDGRSIDTYYDWMIHTLLTSMVSDSASRIFLSKMKTSQFQADRLFPFSAVSPSNSCVVRLPSAFVIAPVWNNLHTLEAISNAAKESEDTQLAPDAPCGVYMKELNLAIITKDIHHMYFSRSAGYGVARLYTYQLRELVKTVKTDGKSWFVLHEKQEPLRFEVFEPRMAALYTIALKRLGITESSTS